MLKNPGSPGATPLHVVSPGLHFLSGNVGSQFLPYLLHRALGSGSGWGPGSWLCPREWPGPRGGLSHAPELLAIPSPDADPFCPGRPGMGLGSGRHSSDLYHHSHCRMCQAVRGGLCSPSGWIMQGTQTGGSQAPCSDQVCGQKSGSTLMPHFCLGTPSELGYGGCRWGWVLWFWLP